MTTFQQLYEQALGRDFWTRDEDSDFDEEVVNLILRGLELRPDRSDGKTFWDDFISVISNNPSTAAKLFGVSSDTIASWTRKIKSVMKEAQAKSKKRERAKMMSTGD